MQLDCTGMGVEKEHSIPSHSVLHSFIADYEWLVEGHTKEADVDGTNRK